MTAREYEVFRMMAHGGSNIEIAGCLFITERTVRAHLVEIQRKLQLSSRLRTCIASYVHDHWCGTDRAEVVAIANGSEPSRAAV